MSVLRFDPFQELDRLTEQALPGRRSRSARSFPIDAYRRGDRLFVHLDLPGVDADQIELTCEQNVLTVRAERVFETQGNDELIVSERPQGVFSRQLFVSDALDTDRIEAYYDRGVLTLELPVAEQAKPRRIQIGDAGSGPKTIEGAATRGE